MPELGRYALFLAGGNSLYVVVLGIWNRYSCSTRLAHSVRGAVFAAALSLTMAVLALEYLLLTGDYAVQAVYNHSDRALPLLYKIGALWGGNSGSVLFWGWILSLYTAVVSVAGHDKKELGSVTLLYLASLLLFFTFMSNLVVDPFRLVPGSPQNGTGLDPLLQNVVMSIHPPTMYIGLIGMAVPGAYLLAGLWTRAPLADWIGVVRRWTLFAWMFLSMAIVLGGMWAYMELGWGGYWEWDPVENASLMPWLLATAFLHSLQAQEKRGILRLWTAVLGVGSFLMTLVGTYITRSGVLKNSVHSFTRTGVGPYFLCLLLIVVIGVLFIFLSRRDLLRDGRGEDLTVSKESLYWLGNILFTSIAVVVLIGTFYPVLSQFFTGTAVVLTKQFFNRLTVPLFIMLGFLLGVMPAAGWQRTRRGSFLPAFKIPLSLSMGTMLAVYICGVRTPLTLTVVGVAVFSGTSMLRRFFSAAKNRQKTHNIHWTRAIFHALTYNRRLYGGYLAHMAFLVIVLGVAGSHTNNVKVTKTLMPRQSITVSGYHIAYQGLSMSLESGYQVIQANLSVQDGHRHFQEKPGLAFFPGSAEPVAQVAIHGTWLNDLYCVLEGSPGHNGATLRIFVNPLVRWIWTGMYLLIVATLWTLAAQHGKDRKRPYRIADTPAVTVGSSGLEGRDPL